MLGHHGEQIAGRVGRGIRAVGVNVNQIEQRIGVGVGKDILEAIAVEIADGVGQHEHALGVGGITDEVPNERHLALGIALHGSDVLNEVEVEDGRIPVEAEDLADRVGGADAAVGQTRDLDQFQRGGRPLEDRKAHAAGVHGQAVNHATEVNGGRHGGKGVVNEHTADPFAGPIDRGRRRDQRDGVEIFTGGQRARRDVKVRIAVGQSRQVGHHQAGQRLEDGHHISARFDASRQRIDETQLGPDDRLARVELPIAIQIDKAVSIGAEAIDVKRHDALAISTYRQLSHDVEVLAQRVGKPETRVEVLQKRSDHVQTRGHIDIGQVRTVVIIQRANAELGVHESLGDKNEFLVRGFGVDVLGAPAQDHAARFGTRSIEAGTVRQNDGLDRDRGAADG